MRFGLFIMVLVWLGLATGLHAQVQSSPYGPDGAPELEQAPKKRPVGERPIDRVFFGGNFGLQVGSVTYINLAPIVGYKVTDRYRVGGGINYIYTNYFGVSDHLVGMRFFQQFFVWKGILTHAEYEFMNYPTGYTNPSGKEISNIANAFNLGAGYQQNFGRRAFTNIIILYNVIHDRNNTIYNTPWSLRFTVGF